MKDYIATYPKNKIPKLHFGHICIYIFKNKIYKRLKVKIKMFKFQILQFDDLEK